MCIRDRSSILRASVGSRSQATGETPPPRKQPSRLALLPVRVLERWQLGPITLAWTARTWASPLRNAVGAWQPR
eukprot:11596252-Alexandrium_andersonii.AAC.1